MMKLKVGEYYLNRLGKLRGPARRTRSLTYMFAASGRCYRCNGLFYEDDVDDEDLIEHLPVTDERHPNYKPLGLCDLVTTINISAFPQIMDIQ